MTDPITAVVERVRSAYGRTLAERWSVEKVATPDLGMLLSHIDAQAEEIANLKAKHGGGTFACPVCGRDSPHNHSDTEVAAHRRNIADKDSLLFQIDAQAARIAELEGTIELWQAGKITREWARVNTSVDGQPNNLEGRWVIMHHAEDPNAEVRDPDTGEVIFPARHVPLRVVLTEAPTT